MTLKPFTGSGGGYGSRYGGDNYSGGQSYNKGKGQACSIFCVA